MSLGVLAEHGSYGFALNGVTVTRKCDNPVK